MHFMIHLWLQPEAMGHKAIFSCMDEETQPMACCSDHMQYIHKRVIQTHVEDCSLMTLISTKNTPQKYHCNLCGCQRHIKRWHLNDNVCKKIAYKFYDEIGFEISMEFILKQINHDQNLTCSKSGDVTTDTEIVQLYDLTNWPTKRLSYNFWHGNIICIFMFSKHVLKCILTLEQ